MPGDEPAPALVDALLDAQRRGFLGPRPVHEVIAHARGFVRAVQSTADEAATGTVLDLGSGAGIPGLVIAHDLPTAQVILLDRRSKRTDALERTVRRLGWQDRVSVVCTDVAAFVPDREIDVVVARGFGPPTVTLRAAARFVRPGGRIVISEPPGVDRWDEELVAGLGLHRLTAPRATTPEADQRGSSADHDLDGLVVVFGAA